MNVKFQVIKNRNPRRQGNGVPDINTLPCALAIVPTRKPPLMPLAEFVKVIRAEESDLLPHQREFLDRIRTTEAKERRDGAA